MTPAKTVDPRKVRLSEHFVLSDFLGNHSVYSRGLVNDFVPGENDPRVANGIALCDCALEPLLRAYGPLSISYGAIGPELSKKIVTYQDPTKPSHHLWNLGAAADVCVHRWVAGEFNTIDDLYLPPSTIGSPVALAHAIDQADVPYSRIITYSESPYLCVAVSDAEVRNEQPRKAFYENRYQNKPKAKPEYLQVSSAASRRRHFAMLQDQGLEHAWQGTGYPTYHGGGFRQYQHMRVSKYTMVSDWLFDLKSITEGAKNIPALNKEEVQDSFAAAGIVYDWLIETLGIPRASIVEGYVSHLNPNFDKCNDWRGKHIKFTVVLPVSTPSAVYKEIQKSNDPMNHAVEFGTMEFGAFLLVNVDVDAVLNMEG